MSLDIFFKLANSSAQGIAAALLAWMIVVGYPSREKQFVEAVALERREYVAALLDEGKRSNDRVDAIEDRCYATMEGNRKMLEKILDRIDHFDQAHMHTSRD